MDILATIGAIGLVFALCDLTDRAVSRYGHTWQRWWRSWSLPFRLWLLERRAARFSRRFRHKAVPLGSLRFKRNRFESED